MIETPRLHIVEATEADIDGIIKLESHKDNRDYLWIGTYEEHLAEIRDAHHLLLVFREKPTAEMIGYALARLDYKSEIFELRRIAISKKGLGFGKEAMVALLKYAFEEKQTNRFWLDVYPDNELGIKLYEGLGMKRDGVLRQNYKSARGYLDQIIYSMLKGEYFSQNTLTKAADGNPCLIIVCSYHHNNTAKVAEAFAQVLSAEVKPPEQVSPEELRAYELIGFGSGIDSGRHYKPLLDFVDALPMADQKAGFVFSTSAMQGDQKVQQDHALLRQKLESKGYKLVGDFSCLGFDTNSVLKYIGGINKGRPNSADLENAKQFAQGLMSPAFPREREDKRPPAIHLMDYEDRYQQDVKTLNYEWLLKYNLLEPMDDVFLDHPREMVLDKGGFILLAETEGQIVGTISAVPIEAGVMELENFAVTEKMQGQKIGRMLLEKCIETARMSGVGKLTLYTNSQLAHALELYRKMGFVMVEPPGNKFQQADLALELNMEAE